MMQKMPNLDLAKIRADFPILQRQVGDQPLVYLDSANTSQKPNSVVAAIKEHYLQHNANVARAMHFLGMEATEAYESAREKIADFIGAKSKEIIFTKNASESLNLAAHILGHDLRPGDEIVISEMEHHSNIVPWQLLCERTGAKLRWFEVTEEGRLDLAAAADSDLINSRTKIVSITAASNVLGTINPVSEIAEAAHRVGAVLVVDGAQAVPHQAIDIKTWGPDFVIFTGHKMCGPTGIGVLWGRHDLLTELPPFLGGGEMIEVVQMEKSTFAPPPHRFEAGTPPIAQAVGLGAAVEYLAKVGLPAIQQHEAALTARALAGLQEIPGLRILGPTEAVDRGSAISFTVDGVHPHDMMQLLDAKGIAVRGGQHCARPIHDRFGVSASTRASTYLYTTEAEIDYLITQVAWAKDFFTSRIGGGRGRH